MLAVEPGGLLGGDEELGSVGVLATVGCRQPAGTKMLQLVVFIGEFLAVDGTTAGSIASLNHEIHDDLVELGSHLGHLDEVLGCDGDGLAEDPDHNGSDRNSADLDVKENLVSDFRSIAVRGSLEGQEREDEESLESHFGEVVNLATSP